MTTRNQSYYALAVLFAINLMNFYDRQILGVITESIKAEWKLSDASVGGLGTAFVLLYATVGVPLGRLADRMNRTKILAVGVTLWSLLTAASGLAQSFAQMFALRLAVGVGEATCAPAANSLLGDLFPKSSRARAMSVFMLGLPIGIALSFFVSAWVTAKWNWRAAFYVAFIPGVLCAIAALFLREPTRGTTESHAIGTLRREGSPWKLVLSIPTMRWLILSGALLNFNLYALGTFLISYLIRVHGVAPFQAASIAMSVYGLSGVPGLLIGGWLGDKVSHSRANGRLLLGTFAAAISAPLFLAGISMRDQPVMYCAVAFGIAEVFLYMYYSAVYPAIQDVIEPTLRGTAMSLYFFAMYLLGGALGPWGFGKLSDIFAARHAAAAGVTLPTDTAERLEALKPFLADGIHSAMHIVPLFCMLLAIVLWLGSRTITRDVETLKAWMSEAAPGK